MKIVDQTYSWQMLGQKSSLWQMKCHFSIFQSHTDVHTVVVTDMGFELSWFNPCITETLVDHITQRFDLTPANLIWLEQYNSDYRALTGTDFSQVVFEWRNGKAKAPQWLTIDPKVAQALIEHKLKVLR